MNRKMKKLNLNRETVRNLSDDKMRTVAGGDWTNPRTDTCTRCSHTCRVETVPDTF